MKRCNLRQGILVILALFLAIVPGHFSKSFAQTVEQTVQAGQPSPNDVKEFKRLLADPNIQSWLIEEAREVPDDDSGAAIGFRDGLGMLATNIRTRLASLKQAAGQFTKTPSIISEKWQEQVSSTETLRVLTYILIFLFVGAGFEWLYAQYTQFRLLALELSKPHGLSERLRTAFFRALITLGGLFVFALGSIGTYLLFEWPDLIADLVLNVLVVVLVLRVATTVTRFFLAPKFKELRLVPLTSPQAKSAHNWLALLVFSGMLNFAVSDVFEAITTSGAPDTSAAAALSVDVVLNSLLLLFTIAAIWLISKQYVNEQNTRGPSRFWAIYLTIIAVAVFVLWLIGAPALMWSALVLGGLFPALSLILGWVNNLFDQAELIDELHGEAAISVDAREGDSEGQISTSKHSEPEDDEAEKPSASAIGAYDTYRTLTARMIRFALVIVTVFGLMGAWGTNPFSLSASPTIGGRLFEIAVDVIVALLIADLVWVWAKSAIDRRMARYTPAADGHAPGPEARMATLLPLLRSILMFGLLAMVIMSILTSFGVNIGPLLAGAGVLGVAIGFGAQALVRDVVSGIFFLIDDAFRIGEYIEIENLRGTVEAMSIRSLRVRHHRGMVHTIPFGELKSLTNHSRDWVIMKLEFRVPFETDLKLVKKLVKKIGAEMKSNEEYGHSILEAPKSQGVRRMEEFNMVVGVKFMTKPGEQWIIRREAYQKIRDAFDQNGIVFAERNVKVEVMSDRQLTPEEEKAVMGAAQTAAEKPSGPPAPIPDEP